MNSWAPMKDQKAWCWSDQAEQERLNGLEAMDPITTSMGWSTLRDGTVARNTQYSTTCRSQMSRTTGNHGLDAKETSPCPTNTWENWISLEEDLLYGCVTPCRRGQT